MFIARLITVIEKWKQHKCPLMDKWIKIVLYRCKEILSALTRKEILTCVTIWMDFEDIMVSKADSQKRQMQHDSG